MNLNIFQVKEIPCLSPSSIGRRDGSTRFSKTCDCCVFEEFCSYHRQAHVVFLTILKGRVKLEGDCLSFFSLDFYSLLTVYTGLIFFPNLLSKLEKSLSFKICCQDIGSS